MIYQGIYHKIIPDSHKCPECGKGKDRVKFTGRKYTKVSGEVSLYYKPICNKCRNDKCKELA